MAETLQTLKTLLGELGDLRHAADLIDWDERVCMPAGGAETHGEMLATLRRIAHEKFTSDTMGRAIEDATRSLNGADDDADDRRLVSVTARDYHKAVNIPADYVAEHARVGSAARSARTEPR